MRIKRRKEHSQNDGGLGKEIYLLLQGIYRHETSSSIDYEGIVVSLTLTAPPPRPLGGGPQSFSKMFFKNTNYKIEKFLRLVSQSLN